MVNIYCKQASLLTPSTFMAQEPHIPSLQDLLYVKDESCSVLILFKASSIIGLQLFQTLRSTLPIHYVILTYSSRLCTIA